MGIVELPFSKALSQGTLKFNCDAAIGLHFSSIVVVTRDWRGSMVLALSKKAYTTSSLQVEAKAIHWTVQITGTTGMNSICLESDLKQCIDALSSSQESIPWCIRRCVVKILSCFDF